MAPPDEVVQEESFYIEVQVTNKSVTDNKSKSTTLGGFPDRDEEKRKLEELFNKAFNRDYHEQFCWNQERRRTLRHITERILIGAIIFGGIFFTLSELWYYLFSTVEIVFRIEPAPSVQLKTVEVKSSFPTLVLYFCMAFTFYSIANLILIAAGIYAAYTFQAQFRARMPRLVVSIFFLLLAAAFMIAGPLLPMMATNNATEIQILRNDEYDAFQKGVVGSIHYYTGDGKSQCNDIKKSVSGKDKGAADEMRVFCDMMFRFQIALYIMLGTSFIPLSAALICILEIAANRKLWGSKAQVRYKDRTVEQKNADKCTTD